MYVHDTIAAISTPLGEGGIGIVRVSGTESLEIAEKIFKREKSGGLKSHRFYYGRVIDPDDDMVVDEAMVIYMSAPKSYTTEDVIEIQCHGGYLVVRKVLDLVLRQGARLAEPGEFTKRAFLNGRIDLVQAEAVIDVIRGKTDAAVALAQNQREGRLSEKLNEAKEGIINALAMIEAYIDFPEEDINLDENDMIESEVEGSREKIVSILNGYDEGRVLREGVTVIIAGKPNVGKSSLMNTLLREKRAIVTSVPGTTRDIIEEIVNIKGLPIRILDTAGIRFTDDEIEQEGVTLALEKIESADLVLFVLDMSRPFDSEDHYILSEIGSKKLLLVKNKIDLPCNNDIPVELRNLTQVDISTATGQGLEELEKTIFETFMHDVAVDSREIILLSNSRQKDSLVRAKVFIESFKSKYSNSEALELVSLDLRSALDAIGEITGETTKDEILDHIFQRFCIGK